jgi:flavodoxin
MSRTLVVYHSRSGRTRRIAQALARRLGADLEDIRIVQPMPGALGYVLCAIEALAGLAPALRAPHRDPSDYELVVIGTPVWFWSVSSPVRSWLESHPMLEARVAFFCTMGASGASCVFDMMRRISRRAPLATLALTDAQVDGGQLDGLERFVQQLQAPTANAARRRSRAPRRLATRRVGVAT